MQKTPSSRALVVPALLFLGLFIFFFTAWPSAASEELENPLQAKALLSPQKISPEQGAELKIELSLPEGYRAYSDQFKLKVIEGSQFKIGTFSINPLVEFFDETSKKKKKGVINKALMTAAVEAPKDLGKESNPLVIKLTYQACTKTFCLFPTTIEVPVHFENAALPIEISQKFTMNQALQKPYDQFLKEGHLVFSFFLIFLAGILTSFTPCVFPMIPITLSVLGKHAHARGKFQNFLVSLVYVLGIALTYSALGVFAASTGALFGSFMNSPLVLGFVCLVFLAMSLSMFGAYEFSLPPKLQNKLGSFHGHGFSGAFLAGAVAGLVASPCVGPVLVGILTHVAQTKSLWLGFWSLFIFAWGMGLLFLFLGVFSSATKMLPKSGPWMEGVKHFFGLLMLGTFYYYLNLLLPHRWFDGVLGLGLITLGSLKGAFEHPTPKPWQKIRKGFCQAVILVGGFLLIVSIFELKTILKTPSVAPTASLQVDKAWQPYSKLAYDQALKEKKPILIDFYADWCAACKELDEYTFSTTQFKTATQDFVLLRFDATSPSPELDSLKMKYGIVGLPTLIFYDKTGLERKDLRITEFVPIARMLSTIQQIQDAP
jgi:thiol:disulfide interchange protein DsbD